MVEDGEIIIYIGTSNDNKLISNKKYKVRCASTTLTPRKFWVCLQNYEYFGHFEFNSNFISLKEDRKRKLYKIKERIWHIGD